MLKLCQVFSDKSSISTMTRSMQHAPLHMKNVFQVDGTRPNGTPRPPSGENFVLLPLAFSNSRQMDRSRGK